MSRSKNDAAEIKKIVEKKPAKQRVYISGFKYTHDLAVGVAYHYRGHYLYAYPEGNPVEPIPFSTKNGIRILGVANNHAPKYNANDPELLQEGSVRALDKSCFHERPGDQERGERVRLEAIQHNTYTPHDRSQYLAYSAPGSRIGSVDSLCKSVALARPSGGLSVPGQGHSEDTTMRTVASTSHLERLILEAEMRGLDENPEFSTQQEEDAQTLEIPSPQDYMDLASMSAFMEAVSRPPSHPPSRPLSRRHSPMPQHVFDAAIRPPDHPHISQDEVPSTIPPATPSPTLYITLSTKGRPRAASQALNETYNATNIHRHGTPPTNTASTSIAASPRCPLHDAPCDGEFVTELHVTLRAQTHPDFETQQVPLMRCADGRVMVDWAALRDEEMKKMGVRE